MAYISWTKDIETGIETVDHQHRTLIKIINDLDESRTKRKDRIFMEHVLDELLEYTNFHFSTEERFMEACCFEDMESHKAEHQEFIEKMETFKRQFLQDKLEITENLLGFLTTWLLTHIKGTDRKLAERLRETELGAQ